MPIMNTSVPDALANFGHSNMSLRFGGIFMTGHKRDCGGQRSMGHRNTRIGRNRDRRRHARHHLEIDSLQRPPLLPLLHRVRTQTGRRPLSRTTTFPSFARSMSNRLISAWS